MAGVNVICRNDVKVRDKSLACVAVDAGLAYAIAHKMNLLQVIGDFDSLKSSAYLQYRDILIKAEAEKDVSDLQLALTYLADLLEPVYVYGALGKRMDHCLVNLRLCYYSSLKIHLIDDYNEIYALDSGRHEIAKTAFKYVSFFTFEQCSLTLQGFKYPLQDYCLRANDNLTLSNEISGAKATIILEGRCLVFLSKD